MTLWKRLTAQRPSRPRIPVFVKLTLFVCGLVVCAASVLSWTGYVYARKLLKEQIDNRFETLTSDRQRMFLSGIAQERELIRLIAPRSRLAHLTEQLTTAEDPGPPRIEGQNFLAAEAATTPNIDELWVVDLEGDVVLASEPSYVGRDFSNEPAFLAGLEETHIGVFNYPTQGAAYVSTPLVLASGRQIGVLMGLWNTQNLVREISDPTGLGKTSEVLVGTIENGELNFLVSPRLAPLDFSKEPVDFPALTKAINGEVGFSTTLDYRHVPVLAFHRPVGYRDWGLVAKIDLDEAYAPLGQLRDNLLTLQGVILLVGAGSSYILARRLIKPIRQLTHAATSIASGDTEARVDVNSNDEIGALATAFNRMVDRVTLAKETLEDRVEERTAQLVSSEAELRQAYSTLDAQAKELARSNAELEQFAYIASHDLQEPLRMVASYVQLLARRYRGNLDGTADEFIQFAVDGAARMQALINDLLIYSRAGIRREPLAPTDAQAVLGTALDNLRIAVDESHAEVVSDPLPTVMGDKSQLTQLFQNLVANALKFRSDQPPKIQIHAERQNGDWEFTVADNGIGFDPKHTDRIFLIFQRLNNRREYPGTGIGLALCKKIVERHGGKIWAESRLGAGSAFHFTLHSDSPQPESPQPDGSPGEATLEASSEQETPAAVATARGAASHEGNGASG